MASLRLCGSKNPLIISSHLVHGSCPRLRTKPQDIVFVERIIGVYRVKLVRQKWRFVAEFVLSELEGLKITA